MTRSSGFLPVPVVVCGRFLVYASLIGCASEVTITEPTPRTAPTPPPAEDSDGSPPQDWDNCTSGFHGRYYNLSSNHPDVEPETDQAPPSDPWTLDWWSDAYFAFERFDPGLDFGTNWWPVDEGLSGDPAYFAVHWTAWIRSYSRDPVPFSLGSADDSWVVVGDIVVAELPGVHAFEVQEMTWTPPSAGQFPIEIYFAHRSGYDDGLRFRLLTDEVTLCYPEY